MKADAAQTAPLAAPATDLASKSEIENATSTTVEVKAPAFAISGFTFPSAIVATPASAESPAKPTDVASSFQLGSVFGKSLNPFSFSFPIGSAAPPDMNTQGNAASLSTPPVKAFESAAAPLSLFGKDIVKSATPFSFSSVPAASIAPAPEDGKEDAGEEDAEPQQPTAILEPSVTGEEDEDTVFQEKCRLYEFSKESKQWIEKGIGKLKLNRSKENQRLRLLMRTEPAHRLAINGVVPKGVPVTLDAKRRKVVGLTLPASYVMGHESAPASEMSILSLRFQEETHSAALHQLLAGGLANAAVSSGSTPHEVAPSPETGKVAQ